MKPNWNNAPVWAGYLAQDADGHWYWYQHPPVHDNNGEWRTTNNTKFDFAGEDDFKLPLEKRP